jgi:hypothetical protein
MKKYRSFAPQLRYDLKTLLLPAAFILLTMISMVSSLFLSYARYLESLINSPVVDSFNIYILTTYSIDSFSLCIFAVLLALYQQFFARQPKRARYFEGLPTTRVQRSISQMLAGSLVIIVPTIISLCYIALTFPATIAQIATYAVASPFKDAVLYQNSIWLPLISFLRYGLVMLMVYSFTLAMTSLFGNIAAGVIFLGCGALVFLGITNLMSANYRYPQVAYYAERIYVLFRSHIFTNFHMYHEPYLPWDDVGAVVAAYLLLTGVFNLISFMMAKKIKMEKVSDVVLNNASRLALLLLATIVGIVFLFGFPPVNSRVIGTFIPHIVIFALLGVFAYALFGKRFKKFKSRGFLSLLLAATLLGGVPAAKADENIANLSPAINPPAILLDKEMLRQQEAFFEALWKLGPLADQTYDHYSGRSFTDSYDSPFPEDTSKALNDPNFVMNYHFIQLLQSQPGKLYWYEVPLTNSCWVEVTALMQSHGYEETAAALLEAISFYKQQPDEAFYTENNERAFSKDNIGFSLNPYYYYSGNVIQYPEEGKSVNIGFYVKLPLSIDGAQAVESALESIPRLNKSGAYHNGEVGYLHYSYSSTDSISYGFMGVSAIIKDGRISHLTLSLEETNRNGYREIAVDALNALLKDSPLALEQALALVDKNGMAQADGYLIKSENSSFYSGSRRLSLILEP